MERSWSIAGTRTEIVTERRFLFFFTASSMAISTLDDAAAALGLPTGLIAAWRRALPGADAIGLAVRDDLASVRLYTQYWDAVANRVRGGNREPALLYAGFKTLPDDTARADSYICLPAAPRDIFMPDIRTAMAHLGVDPTAGDACFAPLSADSCIYTRTEGDGRESWLATVRRAQLPHSDVAKALAPVSRLPCGTEILEAAAQRDMVHIAGGHDGTKGRFTSLYFAADPADLETFMTRP
jgi:hypothetical protein